MEPVTLFQNSTFQVNLAFTTFELLYLAKELVNVADSQSLEFEQISVHFDCLGFVRGVFHKAPEVLENFLDFAGEADRFIGEVVLCNSLSNLTDGDKPALRDSRNHC